MNIKNICKKRIINKANIKTPLIVPSFSSKGFEDIAEIHDYVKEFITEASLVSAYDLYYDNIPKQGQDIYISDILFIDSGGFERDQDTELSELYPTTYISSEWNKDIHSEVIQKIEGYTQIVIVNFDSKERKTIEKQITEASELFDVHPNFISDFLCKPEEVNQDYINVNKIIMQINNLSHFSILGFTEKELGNSVLKRCSSIYRIRKALYENNLDVPIHIFGCIDPLNILAYFLCGADIFDGLSWLRFKFTNSGEAVYRNSHALSNGDWASSDNMLRAKTYADNIDILIKLSTKMHRYLNTYNWDSLDLPSDTLNELQKLVSNVGINY
ncbi:hypothetical protein MM300_10865 [Evansella sp. LMS18]|uniref:hypothetical protein n=1 Tax=Evansella sp. LMS18 TaxID=2924033 RepID=UPI0020D14DED|nr:hypothetical protein [Evansella sp. LMS18]UTR12734.1 hypothetical protein MM300_10865 [Evansella sp. LMS18]